MKVEIVKKKTHKCSSIQVILTCSSNGPLLAAKFHYSAIIAARREYPVCAIVFAPYERQRVEKVWVDRNTHERRRSLQREK